jgi:predicted ribosome quality control (RQC) complex YloA/Tae2 family protein
MHNSYFLLSHLSRELNDELHGFSIVSCFSQSKDELVIEFNNERRSFFLKAHLQPDFCCLSFPTSFNRARKNSVDLFSEVILKSVKSVMQFDNERCFAINLSDDLSLIFKMHGNRANVLVVQDDKIIGIFRNHQEADWQIKPSELNRELNWSLETVTQNESNLKKAFYTLNSEAWTFLESQEFNTSDSKAKWNLLKNLKNQLEKGEFFIIRKDSTLKLLLFPNGEIIKQMQSAIQALNEFFLMRMQTHALDSEKLRAMSLLREKEKQAESYIAKNQPLLNGLLHDAHYQLWGDLIMANLHQINKGAESVSLENYHEPGKLVIIKLKQDLTPQKNAEVFYRKARNQKIEINKLSEALTEKQAQLEKLNIIRKEIESLETPQGIREVLANSGFTKTQQQDVVRLPYRETEFKGYIIRIGKSAADNDELTLKYSHKDDLWLHAKDVAGSHVIVKQQSGKEFPKDVIERAAELAAFYSKRKGESLCPVAVTSKKFVRKRKGDPAGAVVVEKERVILVEPKG